MCSSAIMHFLSVFYLSFRVATRIRTGVATATTWSTDHYTMATENQNRADVHESYDATWRFAKIISERFLVFRIFTSLRGHRSGHGGVESESVPGVLLLAQRETALASRPLAAVYIWLFRESSSHLRARERSAHCNNGETGHKPLRGLALLLTHGGVGCPLPRMRVSLTLAALLCTASLWRRSPRARFALVLELNRAERRIRVQSPAGIGALAHSVGGWARSVANLFPARKSRQE